MRNVGARGVIFGIVPVHFRRSAEGPQQSTVSFQLGRGSQAVVFGIGHRFVSIRVSCFSEENQIVAVVRVQTHGRASVFIHFNSGELFSVDSPARFGCSDEDPRRSASWLVSTLVSCFLKSNRSVSTLVIYFWQSADLRNGLSAGFRTGFR